MELLFWLKTVTVKVFNYNGKTIKHSAKVKVGTLIINPKNAKLEKSF